VRWKRTLALLAVIALPCGTGAEKPQRAATLPAKISFDVAGLELGLGMAEATSKLKALGYDVSQSAFTYKVAPNVRIVRLLLATRRMPVSPAVIDSVFVYLSLPPDAERVVGIYRRIGFQEENAPLMRSYFDVAKQQAGFETFRSELTLRGYGQQMIQWKPDGRPAKDGFGKLIRGISTNPASDTHYCAENYMHMGDPASAKFDEALDVVARNRLRKTDIALPHDPIPSSAVPFNPREFCGTTYIAQIYPRSSRTVISANLMLYDQADMATNGSAHARWLNAQAQSFQKSTVQNAAEPQR
jgi:hypothetical protein